MEPRRSRRRGLSRKTPSPSPCTHIEVYLCLFDGLVRTGDIRLIRRMMECRAITHLLLAEMMPDVPELIEAKRRRKADTTSARLRRLHHGGCGSGPPTEAASELEGYFELGELTTIIYPGFLLAPSVAFQAGGALQGQFTTPKTMIQF